MEVEEIQPIATCKKNDDLSWVYEHCSGSGIRLQKVKQGDLNKVSYISQFAYGGEQTWYITLFPEAVLVDTTTFRPFNIALMDAA